MSTKVRDKVISQTLANWKELGFVDNATAQRLMKLAEDPSLRLVADEEDDNRPRPAKALSVKDFSKQVDCSEKTTRRMLNAGKIKFFRVGEGQGVIRIPAREVERLLGCCS